MVNKVLLIGNLGKDPEVRKLDNGSSVGRFSVATNESYKDKSGEWQNLTEWHNVVVWRQLAERAERTLKKGSMVYVEGKLTTRKWQDKEGNDRYSTEVVANTFRSLEKRESTEASSFPPLPGSKDEKPTTTSNYSTNTTTETANNTQTVKEAETATEDDLPF